MTHLTLLLEEGVGEREREITLNFLEILCSMPSRDPREVLLSKTMCDVVPPVHLIKRGKESRP